MSRLERAFWEFLYVLGLMCMVLQAIVAVVNLVELDLGEFAVAWFFFCVALVMTFMARGELKSR